MIHNMTGDAPTLLVIFIAFVAVYVTLDCVLNGVVNRIEKARKKRANARLFQKVNGYYHGRRNP